MPWVLKHTNSSLVDIWQMEIGVPMCHDFWLFEICKNVLIEVYLIYNIVLVSGIQQSDLVIHICIYLYSFCISFPLWFITRFLIWFLMLYSKTLLFIYFIYDSVHFLGFPSDSVVKNPPANAGDAGSIPGSERSPGEGNSNPPQYSCLGNPMDRRAQQSAVHGVAESDTLKKNNSVHLLTPHL